MYTLSKERQQADAFANLRKLFHTRVSPPDNTTAERLKIPPVRDRYGDDPRGI